jgi:hypothetical protein
MAPPAGDRQSATSFFATSRLQSEEEEFAFIKRAQLKASGLNLLRGIGDLNKVI